MCSLTIMEGFKSKEASKKLPAVVSVMEGFMIKHRNSPFVGWHKRYFVVKEGILQYSRNSSGQHIQVRKPNKIHGVMDLAQCFISYETDSGKIHIDAGMKKYIIRNKDPADFGKWIDVMRVQRVRRQHMLLEQGERVMTDPPTKLNDAQRVILHEISPDLEQMSDNLSKALSTLSDIKSKEGLSDPRINIVREYVENALLTLHQINKQFSSFSYQIGPKKTRENCTNGFESDDSYYDAHDYPNHYQTLIVGKPATARNDGHSSETSEASSM